MPLIMPQAPSPVLPPVGYGNHDCRLEWNSTTTIRLVRCGGKYMMINQRPQLIPAGGVIYTTPLTDANHYVYAYMNAGVMTLYSDVVPFVTEPVTGMAVHRDNYGLSAVGVIWCQSTGIDGPRLVCSYYNRKWHVQTASATPATASSSPVDTGIRIYWVGLFNDIVEAACSGTMYNSTQYAISYTDLRYDDTSLVANNNCVPAVNGYVPIGARYTRVLTGFGLHSVCPFIYNNGPYSGQWYLNVGVGRYC